MTHHELLEKIVNYPDSIVFAQHYRALRAVVELHKPKPEPKDSPFKDACVVCGKTYPCKTIQAIQKELS